MLFCEKYNVMYPNKIRMFMLIVYPMGIIFQCMYVPELLVEWDTLVTTNYEQVCLFQPLAEVVSLQLDDEDHTNFLAKK